MKAQASLRTRQQTSAIAPWTDGKIQIRVRPLHYFVGQACEGQVKIHQSKLFPGRALKLTFYGFEQVYYRDCLDKAEQFVHDDPPEINKTYTYQFAFRIPEWVPGSIFYASDEKKMTMRIKYVLRAQVTPMNQTSFDSCAVEKSRFATDHPIWVYRPPKNPPKINVMHDIKSVVGGMLGFGATECHTKAFIEKTQFYAGDTAIVKIQCDNSTCTKNVLSFKIKLLRRLVALCGENIKTPTENIAQEFNEKYYVKQQKYPGCKDREVVERRLEFQIPEFEDMPALNPGLQQDKHERALVETFTSSFSGNRFRIEYQLKVFVKHDAFSEFGEGVVSKQAIRILQKPYTALMSDNPQADMSYISDQSMMPGESPMDKTFEEVVVEAKQVGVDAQEIANETGFKGDIKDLMDPEAVTSVTPVTPERQPIADEDQDAKDILGELKQEIAEEERQEAEQSQIKEEQADQETTEKKEEDVVPEAQEPVTEEIKEPVAEEVKEPVVEQVEEPIITEKKPKEPESEKVSAAKFSLRAIIQEKLRKMVEQQRLRMLPIGCQIEDQEYFNQVIVPFESRWDEDILEPEEWAIAVPQEDKNIIQVREEVIRQEEEKANQNVAQSRGKRIIKEMNLLNEDAVDGLLFKAHKSQNQVWDIYFLGPSETPYEGGRYHAHLTFPKDFPFLAPQIFMVTNMFHPNVTQEGELVINEIISKWTPQHSVRDLVEQIIPTVIQPDMKNPINKDCAQIFEYSRKKFWETATIWNQANARQ